MSERPAVELKVAVEDSNGVAVGFQNGNILAGDDALDPQPPPDRQRPDVPDVVDSDNVSPTNDGSNNPRPPGGILPTGPTMSKPGPTPTPAGDGNPTTTATTTNTSSTAPAAESSKEESGGLGTGVKAGIAVGVVLVFVLAGVAVFLLMRRKRRRHAEEKGEIGEGMIEHADKKLHDSSNSYSPGGASGGGALHHDSATPPLVGAPLPHPLQQQPMTVHTPRTTTYDEDPVNRPVSPVDDDLLDVAPPRPGSSRGLGGASSSASGAIGGSGGGAGVDDDDDGEMAWILEEERKARERREAAQRLPTSQ